MNRVVSKPLFFWIDDERNPPSPSWVVCRTSQEAVDAVKTHGWPVHMSLDHDLGGDDTVMVFLKRMVNELWDGKIRPPTWTAHSANPEGVKNISSFMGSWIKSMDLP